MSHMTIFAPRVILFHDLQYIIQMNHYEFLARCTFDIAAQPQTENSHPFWRIKGAGLTHNSEWSSYPRVAFAHPSHMCKHAPCTTNHLPLPLQTDLSRRSRNHIGSSCVRASSPLTLPIYHQYGHMLLYTSCTPALQRKLQPALDFVSSDSSSDRNSSI
jgi:hypothetical protein